MGAVFQSRSKNLLTSLHTLIIQRQYLEKHSSQNANNIYYVFVACSWSTWGSSWDSCEPAVDQQDFAHHACTNLEHQFWTLKIQNCSQNSLENTFVELLLSLLVNPGKSASIVQRIYLILLFKRVVYPQAKYCIFLSAMFGRKHEKISTSPKN